MFVGKVVGQLWTTKHVPTLEGFKLLVVLPIQRSETTGRADEDSARHDLVVAADATVGAGVGEYVVVAYGRAARVCLGGNQDVAVEAAIAGVVDELEIEKGLATAPAWKPIPRAKGGR
jgi:microcompartment protein CcmK/EutM